MHSSVIISAIVRPELVPIRRACATFAREPRVHQRMDELTTRRRRSSAISRTIVAEMNMYCSARRQEQRFDLGIEVAVHPRHLELVLEVGHRAQAAQDHARALRVDEVHQQRRRTRTTSTFG